MNDSSAQITIKAIARQNVITLIVFGIAGMLLCALAANFFWQEYRLNIVLLFLFALVTLIIGLFKHFEPINSFELTPQGITYFHRYGQWHLDWDNIMIIDQPHVTEGIESKALSYIGLKLRNTEVLADEVSRRFANNLLQEQRDLYFLACQLENINMLSRHQINDKPFRLESGEKVIGPVGAWLHRTEMLRKCFGYDVFIPLNACDRPPEDFIALLKQCKAASVDHQ